MDMLQELIARQHIMEVKARYCRFLDTRDWEGFGAIFTEDAVLDVREDTGAEPFLGRKAIVATVQAAVMHARSSHQVHNPEIEFVDADTANVIWAMQDRRVLGRRKVTDTGRRANDRVWALLGKICADEWRLVDCVA